MSKILIVEDEEAIADLEKDYLELSGFQVEVANDGAAGLEKALKEDYDMFILDLMLPGIDGFDICRQVRDVKNTPIYDEAFQPQRAGGAGEGASGEIRSSDRERGGGQ